MTSSRSFFTHLVTSEQVERGINATVYPSFEAAYLDVVASIPDMAADVLRRGFDPMKCAFLICDGDDRLVETVHFRELVRGKTEVLEPRQQDLLLPAYGCTIREKARDAFDQLRHTRIETQRLLAASRSLEAKIAERSYQFM